MDTDGGFLYLFFGFTEVKEVGDVRVCIIRELVLFIEGSGFIWISYLTIILFCNDAKEIVPVV